jgi:iron complex outermembrane receptor protein
MSAAANRLSPSPFIVRAAFAALVPLLAWGAPPAAAQELAAANVAAADLAEMSLEDLMNIDITSVSKQKQRISQAPAAVTVITQDDIRRSGLNSIPELLRLSPGLQVAQVQGGTWAISSRGFADAYANKLLVLMDGRTLYTPLFSGVYWQTVDYVLPDLERIEVVRGPGATLWGANAVNGVINITTKSARDTQGWLLEARGGNEGAQGAARYGGRLGEDTYYRAWGKWRTLEDFKTAAGDDANDGWEALRGGFRIDRYSTDRDTLTFQGDAFSSRVGERLNVPSFVPPTFTTGRDATLTNAGANVLARWTHEISDTSDLSLQAYYDHFRVADRRIGYSVDTFDVEFQHRFQPLPRNELIWGAGFRFQSDHVTSSELIRVDPSSRDDYVANVFVQDDLTIVPDRLHFIFGSKFEANSYTGFEVQPSARLLWTPDDRNSVWLAVSRAVRTPSRVDENGRVALQRGIDPLTTLPFTADIRGNPRMASEKLWAYEVGYRVQPAKTLTVDVAAFANVYDDLRSFDTAPPAGAIPELTEAPPRVFIPLDAGNELRGESYGVEVAANWNVSPDWRLAASYTFLTLQVHQSSSSTDVFTQASLERAEPRNQLQIHSYYDLTKDLELNASVYFVEQLRGGGAPGYVRFDANVTWRPRPGMELAVGVQNAFDDRHNEFGNDLYSVSTQVPRTVFAQLVWKF